MPNPNPNPNPSPSPNPNPKVLDVGVALPASRTHETEADELGLKLCARSCHAPRLAAQAHSTLAAIERSAGRDAAAASIFATHPPTDARASALVQQVPAGCNPM